MVDCGLGGTLLQSESEYEPQNCPILASTEGAVGEGELYNIRHDGCHPWEKILRDV